MEIQASQLVHRRPWKKLIAKYERGTTFAYDHYVFNARHPQRNRITDADIATANALMNANAGATLDSLDRLRAAQDDLEPLLGTSEVEPALQRFADLGSSR